MKNFRLFGLALAGVVLLTSGCIKYDFAFTSTQLRNNGDKFGTLVVKSFQNARPADQTKGQLKLGEGLAKGAGFFNPPSICADDAKWRSENVPETVADLFRQDYKTCGLFDAVKADGPADYVLSASIKDLYVAYRPHPATAILGLPMIGSAAGFALAAKAGSNTAMAVLMGGMIVFGTVMGQFPTSFDAKASFDMTLSDGAGQELWKGTITEERVIKVPSFAGDTKWYAEYLVPEIINGAINKSIYAVAEALNKGSKS